MNIGNMEFMHTEHNVYNQFCNMQLLGHKKTCNIIYPPRCVCGVCAVCVSVCVWGGGGAVCVMCACMLCVCGVCVCVHAVCVCVQCVCVCDVGGCVVDGCGCAVNGFMCVRWI